MKKIMALLLTFLFSLSLYACDNDSSKAENTVSNNKISKVDTTSETKNKDKDVGSRSKSKTEENDASPDKAEESKPADDKTDPATEAASVQPSEDLISQEENTSSTSLSSAGTPSTSSASSDTLSSASAGTPSSSGTPSTSSASSNINPTPSDTGDTSTTSALSTPSTESAPEMREDTSITQPATEPDTPAAPESAAGANTSLDNVKNEIVNTFSITDYLDIDSDQLLDVYGIAQEDYTESASFATMSGAFPHEVIMLRAVDGAAAERITEKLQSRLDEVRNQYRDYDAENYAIAQECSVNTEGLIVSLFMSPDHDVMQDILSDSL